MTSRFFNTDKLSKRTKIDAPLLFTLSTDKSFEHSLNDGAKKYAPINLTVDLADLSKKHEGVDLSVVFAHINAQLKTLLKDTNETTKVESLYQNDKVLNDISEVIYMAQHKISLTAKVQTIKAESMQEIKAANTAWTAAKAEHEKLVETRQQKHEQWLKLGAEIAEHDKEIINSEARVNIAQHRVVNLLAQINPKFASARNQANELAQQLGDNHLAINQSPALTA